MPAAALLMAGAAVGQELTEDTDEITTLTVGQAKALAQCKSQLSSPASPRSLTRRRQRCGLVPRSTSAPSSGDSPPGGVIRPRSPRGDRTVDGTSTGDGRVQGGHWSCAG